ncbi:MAG: ubiquinol-cytochrome c reductase iron-sulfur subunit [Halobacteriaceae archaeon]
MSADDKYPQESGRRRFVKGVVGAASLAAVGTTGAVTVDSATNRSGAGGGTTQYFGVENTGGPAPRGMPLIPIQIDSDGYVQGRYPSGGGAHPTMDIGGIEYSPSWFQYCGVQQYQGLQPSYEGDNYFRYVPSSSPNAYDWHADMAGNRINVGDFEGYETWGNGIGKSGLGMPAAGTWRSQNVDNSMPVQLIRSTRIEEAAQNPQTPGEEFLAAASDQGVIAILDKCTHFCCVPGFKLSAQSEKFDAENDIFCPCHQSVYDPFSIVKVSFVAYPRPEEG